MTGSFSTNGAYQLELASWPDLLIAAIAVAGLATALVPAGHLGVRTNEPALAPTEERP